MFPTIFYIFIILSTGLVLPCPLIGKDGDGDAGLRSHWRGAFRRVRRLLRRLAPRSHGGLQQQVPGGGRRRAQRGKDPQTQGTDRQTDRFVFICFVVVVVVVVMRV